MKRATTGTLCFVLAMDLKPFMVIPRALAIGPVDAF
jgi:hypothetical protein